MTERRALAAVLEPMWPYLNFCLQERSLVGYFLDQDDRLYKDGKKEGEKGGEKEEKKEEKG